MRRILLTSAGFESGRIGQLFLELLGKAPAEAKALFIPTAANSADAIAVLPKCMDDLLGLGIQKGNITVFDLHRSLTFEEAMQYDAIYVCGGSSSYLLGRINDTGFAEPLKRFVAEGGVYVGVSAGSIVAANNLPDNLGFIRCTLGVHKPVGPEPGPVDASSCPHIDLTDSRAMLIRGDECRIVE